MLCQDLAVPLGAELVQQLGRPLHVAEEEGDCSRWKIAFHSTTSCATTVATSGADVERAGATGLEPATSGVTGRSADHDVRRRSATDGSTTWCGAAPFAP